MRIALTRTAAITFLSLLLILGLVGCVGGPSVPPEAKSRGLKRVDVAPIAEGDRRIILDLASASLEYERSSGFSAVRAAPVTEEEMSRLVLGDVERAYRIVPAELSSEASLFDASRVADENSVSVPVMLGARCIAEFGFERIDGRWEPGSVRCESPSLDRARAQVSQAIPGALGGSPDQTRSVDVDGSQWVIARRGNREVAGLVDYFAYGTFGDPSVRLPGAPTVITDEEFRALLGQMKARQ